MKKTALVLLAGVSALAPAAALAQEAAASVDESEAVAQADVVDDSGAIVVTAQRRSENAQRVPISLTAVTAATLEKATIDNIQSLPRVAPSLFVQRSPQAANTRISIRGIGSAGNAALEPSVGAYVDGIYIPRPGPLLAGLNDLAGIEVLRGPQGTLFGRNAAVGALNIRTNAPTGDFGGSLTLEGGSFGKLRAAGYINLPVADTAATRVAVLYDRSDGFGINLTDNQRFGAAETFSIRGSAKLELSPAIDWIVRGDFQRITGDGLNPVSLMASTLTPTARANIISRLDGLTPRLDTDYDRRVRQTSGGNMRDNQWGVSSELSWDLGGPSLRLLSGYRDWDTRQRDRDFSLTPADLMGRDATFSSRSHSQELQLVSPSGGKLTYVAGLYYFRENYRFGTTYDLGTGYCPILINNTRPALEAACNAGPARNAAVTDFGQITKSLAAYGQLTYAFTPEWDVTVGLRYSDDRKSAALFAAVPNPAAALVVAAGSSNLRYEGDKVTYRINTTYRPDRDVMLFATVSTGFKSGGFDSGQGSVVADPQSRIFRPETVTNYELGIKSEWFDRMLTANATLFRMDIDDFQLRSYNGTTFSVRNAGSIRQQGAEFELSVRPAEGLTLALIGTRLLSKYTSFRDAPGLPGFGGVQDLTGARVPYSPKWQGTGSIDYRTPITSSLDLGFNGRVAFMSDSDVGGAADNNPQGIQPAYALLGGRISLYGPDDRWQLAVSGENLANKKYCTGIYSQTFGPLLGLNDPVTGGSVQRCILGEPRTLRVSASVKF